MTAKQSAINQAAQGAGQEWLAQAETALRYWCKLKRGGPFAAWHVVQWANKKFPALAERDGRAWGWMFQSAYRDGRIAHAGYAVNPGRHGSHCRMWEVV